MRLRAVLAFGVALLTFGAGSPIQALADDSLIAMAKWGEEGGAGPGLTGDNDIPIGSDPTLGGPGGRTARLGTASGVQINDPGLDHIQTFSGTSTDPARFRPFEFSVQSETSVAAFGDNVVVGYNSSANQPVVLVGGNLLFTHRFLSGYSFSHDAGATWAGGFIPPSTGSVFTAGDPSVAVDRDGTFLYASLGLAPSGHFDVTVSRSTDGGTTFAPARIVDTDDGVDKEWIGVGPDPANGGNDSAYVTWTSFYPIIPNTPPTGSKLMFAKSTDGGITWSSPRTLFAPVDNGTLSSFIQFTNPVVDASSGRLYIPFLHFSDFDADFIKVLVSDNGGATFSFLNFNVPGAPETTGFPNVTPGTIADCGSPGGGVRLVLHSGANMGGGRFGLPRYRHATRLVTQPATAANHGQLFIAFNSSTSPSIGDPSSGSEIKMLFSPDGGSSWQLSAVAGATDADRQHVHPAVSVDAQGEHVSVGYYVQQANEQLRVDLATGQVTGHGVEFKSGKVQNLGAPFDLTPSNNPIPRPAAPGQPAQPFRTTNYDRSIVACYNIGEYMSTTYSHERVIAAWGDNRNGWTSPTGSPAAGSHSQPDAFAEVVQAK